MSEVWSFIWCDVPARTSLFEEAMIGAAGRGGTHRALCAWSTAVPPSGGAVCLERLANEPFKPKLAFGLLAGRHAHSTPQLGIRQERGHAVDKRYVFVAPDEKTGRPVIDQAR